MSKVLVLDAGHGLYTQGKQTMNGSAGVIKEWTLNQAVCNYITDLLDDYDVKIYRTDDTTGKTDVSLSSRVSKTNGYNPDLFVSIHHNAGGGTGTEVYYHTYGTAADKEMASIIAPKLAANLNCRNRGVKYASFAVLTCKATAILVEGGFMDTLGDYNVMITPEGQLAYAKAVAESIISFLKLKKVSSATPVSPTKNPSSTLKVGDKVAITGSNYSTGQRIPTWVKTNNYEITRISGKKALLSSIVSWVDLVDLREVDAKKVVTKNFLVEVTTPILNVRQYANFDSKIVGTVRKGEVFTIVEEVNGLGKLKSGAGWISLNEAYVKRC